jgi:hypothetical protein
LEEIPIIKSHELNEYQLEWISLVAQFDNQIEKEFFKPYWVPVSKNEYEYFVDLSSRSFTVFKIKFHPLEPCHWQCEEIIADISEFILALDNKTISFDEILYDNDGNPLDENGNPRITESNPTYCNDQRELQTIFKGYDFASIHDDDVVVYGYFLESPVEERLIEMFNYIPVNDNSTKPYQANWMICENKLFLLYVNATINGKELTSYDIVPEYTGDDVDKPYIYSTNCNNSITFIIEKIENPRYSCSMYNVGDTLGLEFFDGVLMNVEGKTSN